MRDFESKRYVTEKEVAELTGIAVQSLRNQRHLGRGFPYRKFGKSVRYLLPEILSIMESHRNVINLTLMCIARYTIKLVPTKLPHFLFLKAVTARF